METFEEQNFIQQPEHLLNEEPVPQKPSSWKKFWAKIRWLVVLGLVLFIGWWLYAVFFQKVEFLNPLAFGQVLSVKTREDKNYETIGFLPYWSVNRKAEVPWQSLDEVIFFGFSVDKKGNIGESEQDRISWRALNSDHFQIIKAAMTDGKRLGVAFTCFNDEVINDFLNNQKTIDNFISQAKEIADEYDFQSFNIDFEFTSLDQPTGTKENFNRFMRQLKAAFPDKRLSFDVYANAIIQQRPYDIKSLGEIVDQMIIMAYDFHRSASDNAGPVAPIKEPYPLARSISEALEASFNLVPSEKTVLGVPLYGYEWETVNEDIYALVVPKSGSLASFSRARELIQEKDLKVNWDPQAFSPWLVYEDEDGKTKQIYFENLYSLSLKYQLVKQLDLAGVAYWALGYEGEFTDVWQQAVEKLKPSG